LPVARTGRCTVNTLPVARTGRCTVNTLPVARTGNKTTCLAFFLSWPGQIRNGTVEKIHEVLRIET